MFQRTPEGIEKGQQRTGSFRELKAARVLIENLLDPTIDPLADVERLDLVVG